MILLNIFIHLVGTGWLSGIAKDTELQQVRHEVGELKTSTSDIGKNVNDLSKEFAKLSGVLIGRSQQTQPADAQIIPRKVVAKKPPQKKGLF